MREEKEKSDRSKLESFSTPAHKRLNHTLDAEPKLGFEQRAARYKNYTNATSRLNGIFNTMDDNLPDDDYIDIVARVARARRHKQVKANLDKVKDRVLQKSELARRNRQTLMLPQEITPLLNVTQVSLALTPELHAHWQGALPEHHQGADQRPPQSPLGFR